jgi:hypothetical protein
MKLNFVLVVVCSVVFLGCHDSKTASQKNLPSQSNDELSKTNWTVDELVQFIDSVGPWSSESTYAASDWSKMIRVAKIFQKTDSAKITQAFDKFSADTGRNFHANYLEESKPFLLLHVIFDLPQHADIKGRFVWGWVSLNKDSNSDGTVNLSWPIEWKEGKPKLISRYMGYEGFSYNPSQDYLYLLKHFKMRDLSSFGGGRATP